MLSSLSIPNTDHINYHRIESYTPECAKQHSRLDLSKLPFYTCLDNMIVIMNTSSIEREYRHYLPLLLDVIMESPVKRNGELIPHERVVAEVEADTVYKLVGNKHHTFM